MLQTALLNILLSLLITSWVEHVLLSSDENPKTHAVIPTVAELGSDLTGKDPFSQQCLKSTGVKGISHAGTLRLQCS